MPCDVEGALFQEFIIFLFLFFLSSNSFVVKFRSQYRYVLMSSLLSKGEPYECGAASQRNMPTLPSNDVEEPIPNTDLGSSRDSPSKIIPENGTGAKSVSGL
ncbi:hypothetical protein KC19_VG157400 [Ceratodon purpureus]|uniref:Uncharacterized protein n=1 Tax=Ceratodon purpureus TaxID=3225 RepID=A0A8T0HQY1_CERPU|nr:hypothetical protein KC19_VG157400 [Ceratodon purpureus]